MSTQSTAAEFDLAIIGGGINGAGIARDAAGRGLKVLLVEQSDLASGTSSASTKLVHGGLRYLEHAAFRLVHEALIERDVLLRIAPHIVRPMRFILPVGETQRPPWMIRIGLALYDWLGRHKSLPRSRKLDLARDPEGAPLLAGFRTGFDYWDCVVDDSRLVVLNAVDAAFRGADIRTRTRCLRADRSDVWHLTLETEGRRGVVTTRALVNATGPWTARFAEMVLRLPAPEPVRLVKGSHIVVPRFYAHASAYILQNPDRRVVFAIPYHHDFTLIGTTDENFVGDPAAVTPSTAEIAYLCEAATRYFRAEISPAQVVWAFAGVRSLYDDGSRKAQDVTRDYVLALDADNRSAPLLDIYGGKITTYRRLAEAALAKLSHVFEIGPAWTAGTPLPGGDLKGESIGDFAQRFAREHSFLPVSLANRLVAAYGTRAVDVVAGARSLGDLGPRFGADLTAAEVRYLMRFEWAQMAEDVLWRRSKLGLGLAKTDAQRLAHVMAGATAGADQL
ncbi:MAG: glycerol-3-phosphate dehydrogenase [Xanthobacteraceae bacterium]|nr:glycerol-3-phosphate dehydrogenase [Xanthobacteraceae bacterium]